MLAHVGEPLAPHDLASAWSTDPFIVGGLAVTAWVYVRGVRRLWRAAEPGRGVRRREAWCFALGWLTLAIALVSPLHAMGEVLFSAHMVQHELLMVLAAPLLVMGRPLVAFVWALSPRWRRRSGAWAHRDGVRTVWRSITAPVAAWSIHAAALWLWHLPGPYQATLTHGGVHAAQHWSFLGSALLFWWALLGARERSGERGAGVLYLFTTMLHTGILGALLTFSDVLWYPAYYATTGPWGISPIDDQRLGGLIMWIPAGTVYIVAALVILARLLRDSSWSVERQARAARGALVAIAFGGSALVAGACGPGPSKAEAAVALTGGSPERGKEEIRRFGCGSCHEIAGVPGAQGLVGPPLTGIADRAYIAGRLANSPSNLMRWIMIPQGVDSLTAMPNLGVSEQQARDIAAYLYTLR